MPKMNKRQTLTGLGCGILIGGWGWIATQPAVAQGTDPLDVSRQQTSDPFSNQNSGYEPFFDMMHRVQLGNIRTVSEYGKDQQESLGSEASDFRQRQLQMIQQQSNPASPAAATQPLPGSTATPSP
ncbi:MAG: hypothetical protein MUF72_02920 [Elainella sp. Prado103]|jgi:hypothetical protein|nr:hypothetical protein [Elainella sp. Prado103]